MQMVGSQPETVGPHPLREPETPAQSNGLVQWDDASLEILLAAWPEIHINRSSIFDITVELAEETQTDQEEIITSAPRPLKQESKKQARERHSWQRRKSTTGPGASQERLWD
jgi:hypothetical protein